MANTQHHVPTAPVAPPPPAARGIFAASPTPATVLERAAGSPYPGEETVGFTVIADTMSPMFEVGDTALVDLGDEDLRPGDTALLMDGSGEGRIARCVQVEGDHWIAEQIKPARRFVVPPAWTKHRVVGRFRQIATAADLGRP